MTSKEIIKRLIQDWEDYCFPTPIYDPNWRNTLLSWNLAQHEKYVLTFGRSLFSTLRDARLLSEALMDTILYPEEVVRFMDRIVEEEIAVVRSISGCGIDGWMIADDLGMQQTTFISPAAFRKLFKPAYQKLAAAVHEAGMDMFMHSCGYNYGLMEDLIDAGIDVFQLDQPDAYPTEVLAKEFANRITFYTPVDIQKVLPTGNIALIEARAKEMCDLFCAAGGAWIAKDYPTYRDIGVDPAWAHRAQDVIVLHSTLSKQ